MGSCLETPMRVYISDHGTPGKINEGVSSDSGGYFN